MNWLLLQNSVLVAGGTALAALAVGFGTALWLRGLRDAWRRVGVAAAVIGLALPPFLITNCWLDLLGHAGRWRRWAPLEIYSLSGTVWILTLWLWPVSLLFILAALRKLQPAQLESEPALGGWNLIRWLILPAARGSMVAAGLLTFVLAWSNFAVPAILQTKVFPAEVWVSFNTTFDYAQALALSWPLLVVPALVLLARPRMAVIWPRAEAALRPALFRCRLGRGWHWSAAVAGVGALTASTAVPLSDLVLTSRTWAELPGAFAAGQPAVLNSIYFAGIAATVCMLTGLALARRRWPVVLWLLFLVPGVLLGIALIFLLNRGPLSGFYQSAGVVILALSLRYVAVSWSGAVEARRSLDTRWSDVARLHGATRWQMLRHVTWPQIGAELGAVWIVTYLFCLWDVETLILIIPPGCETLALRVFNLLHYGHNAQVHALCVLLLGAALLPLAVWRVGRAALRARAGLPWAAKICFLALFCALAGSAGCDPLAPNEARLESRLFGRVQVIGSRGTGLGQFNKPRSLAVDSADNLYVVDMTGRVQKFSPDGAYLLSWQMPQTEKGKPKGMCRDAEGNIVVVEPHYGRVNHYSPQGQLMAQWGAAGTNRGQLCLPRAIVANSAGDLVVCEYTQVDRVQRFSARGAAFQMAFGHSGRGSGELNRPEGLAVDREDRIYVADSCNHRVQVFSREGEFLRSYGRPGRGLGEMSYPYDVQVDAAGLQFVAEFGNSRVQVFDPAGHPVEIIGGSGSAPGQMSNPWSLALDSAGNLYVADSQNHRVQKFIRKEPVRHTSGSSERAGRWNLALAPSEALGSDSKTP